MNTASSKTNQLTVSIVGAHGAIARHLSRLLAEKGHTVRGLVRKQEQFEDVQSDGGEPVLCDVESASSQDMDTALKSSDVVVFAAGAGPGSGAERKQTVDRDGAIASLGAAQRVGADRFVIVSSMGTDDPPQDDEVFSVYLRAKAAADEAVRAAEIAGTIVRPGGLTDEEPTGEVQLGPSVDRGEIPRADVAAVIAELIDSGNGRDVTFELVSGPTPIADAVAGMA